MFDSELFDSRYIVYRRDRESSCFHAGKEDGGVLVAVLNSHKSFRLSNLESNCEDLWICIEPKAKTSEALYICTAYLPPPI